MKPKLLVESDKYLTQVFQGTGFFCAIFFPHRIEPSVGL